VHGAGQDPGHMSTPFIVQPGEGRLLDLGNLFSLAAMVGFFEELAEAEAKGTPTPELLAEISERNHMGIVGPVPDSYL